MINDRTCLLVFLLYWFRKVGVAVLSSPSLPGSPNFDFLLQLLYNFIGHQLGAGCKLFHSEIAQVAWTTRNDFRHQMPRRLTWREVILEWQGCGRTAQQIQHNLNRVMSTRITQIKSSCLWILDGKQHGFPSLSAVAHIPSVLPKWLHSTRVTSSSWFITRGSLPPSASHITSHAHCECEERRRKSQEQLSEPVTEP